MNLYQENILDHYKNPRNFADLSQEADVAKSSNLSCGDEIGVRATVADGIIEDIKFDGAGCSIAIAAASILYEEMIGKSVEDVNNMTVDDLIELIGIELTSSRVRCAELSLEALKKQIANSG